MADHEFYKEKVTIRHGPGMESETVEKSAEKYPEHVEHVYYEQDGERRRHWRQRGLVRREILTFRQGVYLALEFIEALLIIEFLIRLFGIPPVNFFVGLVNALTLPLLAPFGALTTLVAPYFLVDWSIVLAILLYGLLAYIITALFESGLRAAYRRHY